MKSFIKIALITIGVIIAYIAFMYVQLIVIPVIIFVGLAIYILYRIILENSGGNKEEVGTINRDSVLTEEDEIEEESVSTDEYWKRLNMSLDQFKLLSNEEKIKMIAIHGHVVRVKTHGAEKHEIYRLLKFMVEVVSVSRGSAYKPEQIEPFDIANEVHERFEKYE